MPSALFCWLGKTDLDAMARQDIHDVGPIARALRHFIDQRWPLDRFVLLNNYDASRSDPAAFVAWLQPWLDTLGAAPVIWPAPFPNPTDFRAIYEAVTEAITATDVAYAPAPVTRYFHLSPGTSAMTAVWLLLGKTTHPATLLSASREEGVRSADVPFDISANYIPLSDLHARDLALQQQLHRPLPEHFGTFICASDELRRVVARAAHVAPFHVPVLLMGESGTGKTQLAQCIHRTCFPTNSTSKTPFVVVNCSAIPRDLVEAELFGAMRGAYTGSTQDRKGLLREADGGTLFLDEIAELPLDAQSKLLRALESQRVRPVGDTREHPIQVRIVSATHQDLRLLVAQGRFREDLYYRLAVATLTLPPLRERAADLPLLCTHLLDRIRERLRLSSPKTLSPQALGALRAYAWPGNVRELENVLTQAVLWTPGQIITPDAIYDLLRPISPPPKCLCEAPINQGFNLQAHTDTIQRRYIAQALALSHQNRRKAASLLGFKNHTTFLNWLKRLAFQTSDPPPQD